MPPDASAICGIAPQVEALPSQVQALCPRMREVASIVYRNGGATVRQVQQAINDPLTIYGIRTMLRRLAKRGIVKGRPSGRHTEVLYVPAILTDRVKEAALNKFIVEHFDGSCFVALQIALRLVGGGQIISPAKSISSIRR